MQRYLLSLAASAGYAARGLRWTLRSDFHIGLVLLVSAGAALLGWRVGLAPLEWVALALAAALVLTAELVNTALEVALDVLHPARNPSVARAKDVAAAAVLVSIIAAGLTVLLVFVPHLGS